MRIGLVNQPWGHIVPPVVTGGSIPLILYEMAWRMAGKHEVLYYTRTKWKTREIIEQSVRYRYLPIAIDKVIGKVLDKVGKFPDFRKPKFASRWSYAGYAAELARDVKKQGCDVVHIVNMSQFVPAVRRKNRKAKIVLHMECEWLNQLDADFLRPRIEQCDAVIGCSNFITRKAAAKFPGLEGKFRTVFNGVDVQRFTSKWDKPIDKPADALKIVYVGRITPEKGVHTLLEAFARLAGKYPKATLDIVGPEEINPPELVVPFADDPKVFELMPLFEMGRPYWKLLEKLSAPLGDRVKFIGNVPQSPRLVELYQSGDICVIPSVWEEPFGIPVAEGMAAGAPLIATRGGAFPEIVEEGKTGLLVERGSVDQLTEALDRLLSDAALRESMGRAGRQRAVEVFSWDRIAGEFLSVYESVR